MVNNYRQINNYNYVKKNYYNYVEINGWKLYKIFF